MDARGGAPGGTSAARFFAAALTAVTGLGATSLFLQYGSADGLDAVDVLRALLIFGSTTWLAWGASQGLIGLWPRRIARSGGGPVQGRTVVLVPVYNEDPVVTFARVAAMDASVRAVLPQATVHFAILSDTRDPAIARDEARWFARLMRDTDGAGRLFYRRRDDNSGKKAGNIEDFIRRSGAAYDYAVILDADSLMEGGTIAEMIRRIEAEPGLGLLQTLPKVVRARSRFGRAMQFAASFYSPVFARGLARMQGRTGPFWGHNAIVRVRAFAESCGLPVLSGKPPFGGHILSHDYVEAALLARAGWEVRLDEDLEGSFEEGPENIVDHAKRDRRWAQGNLQHARLVGAPGLRGWSRLVFLQGIMAYVAPLFWAGFLLASIADAMRPHVPDYFPDTYQLFPVFPSDETAKAVGLAIGIFGMLVMPKLSIVVEAVLTGRARGFGGGLTALVSTVSELLLSSLIAPLMLMYQSRSVLQILAGRDGGWPPNNRGDGQIGLADAWAASRFIVGFGLAGLLTVWYLAPALTVWMIPVGGPMLLAPFLIAWSSRPAPGTRLYTVPTDGETPAIVAAHDHVLQYWTRAVPADETDDDLPSEPAYA